MTTIQNALSQANLNHAARRLESLFETLEDDYSNLNRVRRELERLEGRIQANEKIVEGIQSGEITVLTDILARIEAAKTASFTKA